MKVSEVMTRDVQTVRPDQTAQQAASFMLNADAGSIPVADGDRLIGMITDRDIAVRGVARGHGPPRTTECRGAWPCGAVDCDALEGVACLSPRRGFGVARSSEPHVAPCEAKPLQATGAEPAPNRLQS